MFVLPARAYLPAAVDTLDTLSDYVTARFARERTDPIAPGEDLMRAGILDSMAIMELVGFLETTWGLSVEGDEVTVDNFQTLSAMAGLVERKLGA